MKKTRVPPRKNEGPQEFSAIIDCGGDYNEDDLIDFLNGLSEERYNTKLNFVNKSSIQGMFCLLFSNHRDLKHLLELNGAKFNGRNLFITQLFWEKYTSQLEPLKKYFMDHYESGVFDFTDMQKNFSKLFFKYYPDFQFLLFYLGVLIRRDSLKCSTVDFTRNNIPQLSLFRNINVFLPKLKKLILDKNPISNTDEISSILPGITVKYNSLTFGGDQYELDENGYPDVTKSKREYSDENESEESERNQYSSRNYSDHSNYSEDSDQEEEKEPKESQLSEIKSFLLDFLAQSKDSLSSIHSFYSSNAAYSFLIRSIHAGEDLFQLKDFNQNLAYQSPKSSVTVGDVNIALKQYSIFDGSFDFDIETMHCNKVENLFYVVTMNGKVQIKGNSFHLDRTLTLVGENGILLISNDVMFITYK